MQVIKSSESNFNQIWLPYLFGCHGKKYDGVLYGKINEIDLMRKQPSG